MLIAEVVVADLYVDEKFDDAIDSWKKQNAHLVDADAAVF